MRIIAASSGKGRRLAMLAAAGILAMGLAACSSDDDTTSGSPFTQALQKDYSDLSSQASALPAERCQPKLPSSIRSIPSPAATPPVTRWPRLSPPRPIWPIGGTEPEAEAANGPAQTTIRARLVRAVAAGKDQFPEQAARAQADYDCWVIYATVSSAAAASQACKTALDSSLLRLETSARPAPPPAPAPVPAPFRRPRPHPRRLLQPRPTMCSLSISTSIPGS